MGLTAERLADRFGITRQAADEFSLRSHQKALAAIQAGKFADETVPVNVSFTTAERLETEAAGDCVQSG